VTRSVPPLNPLHVFEVAARLGNFTKAAGELGITQSAVSRQIGTLEDYLNVRLFERARAGVSLTKAGKEYFRDIQAAFATIVASTGRLRGKDGPQTLHVSVYPTFAMKWLAPRIDDFNADYPLIQLRVTATVRELDFVSKGIDLAIRLLPDSDAEPRFIKLFSDMIQPVCSPGLLDEAGRQINSVEALGKFRLLHSRYRRSDWRDWFAAMGVTEFAERGIEFSSSVLTYQAAMEGMGVAMGQTLLLEQEFKSGKLIPLFDPPLERPMSYYVTWSKHVEPNYRARAFIHWLQRQCELEGAKAD
jgi:LysR family glycine cleavage system transcriptional activator